MNICNLTSKLRALVFFSFLDAKFFLRKIFWGETCKGRQGSSEGRAMIPFGLQEESLAVAWMMDLGVWGVWLDWRGHPWALEQDSTICPGAQRGWPLPVENGVEGPLSSGDSNDTGPGRKEMRHALCQVTHQSPPHPQAASQAALTSA